VRGEKQCDDVRDDILSKKQSARSFGAAVRGHWGIESMHWQLDMTFGEDRSRTRRGHADANFRILRRTALSLLKNETTEKVGMKNKRLIAAWNEGYLEKALFGT
jgi:predicted transposase YbfD/YdcC